MHFTFYMFVHFAVLLPLLTRGFIEGKDVPRRIRGKTEQKKALELMGIKNAIDRLPEGAGDSKFWTHHFLQELSMSITTPPTTSPPTKAPTDPATDPPTKAPTDPATDPPTKAPTDPATDPPTKAPTPTSPPTPRCPSCNETAQERFDLAYGIVETISDPVDINNTDTPQGKCFQWIVDEDPYCSCPETDPKFYQRYVMCVYYYSLDGGNWNECNAPDDPNDPAQVATANANCNITAEGPDVFQVPIYGGTDAWLTPVYECYWGGLACRNSSDCMDRIEFEDDGLGGTLPYELQNLTELRYIIIEEGTTAGTIPSEYAVFPRLHILDLNFNALTGPIPVEIYDVEFLFQLDLNDNFLNGTIATEIGNFDFIQFIQFEANKLTGTIPSELGNATSLQIFEAYGNELSGSMPQEVCNNRNIDNYNGSKRLIRLTVDCDADDIFYVECEVPTCCTDCPN